MQNKKLSREEAAVAFWERLDWLIGDERPYAWATSKGINRSGFQSARERRTKPLSKTVQDWATKIGCSFEWLDTGEGEPFPGDKPALNPEFVLDKDINYEVLEKSFETLDVILSNSRQLMTPSEKARLIITIYKMYASSTQPDLMREQIIQLVKPLINK
jgi:hypothetical protein